MDDERIARLEERVNLWMETTNDYRKTMCGKLDRMFEKLNSLPCDARCKETEAIHNDISWLQKIVYGIIVFGVPALISIAVAWGALNNDVIHLKNTSYGYRGIKVVTEDVKKEDLGV